MSGLNFNLVVLDGANIIHDNLGNGKKTLEPKRLLSAIKHCVDKGWETVAVLKHGTYYWPPKWPKNLKEKLGFPRSKKFTSFLEDLSHIVTKYTSHRI